MPGPVMSLSRDEERGVRMRVWKERYEHSLRELPSFPPGMPTPRAERRHYPRIQFPRGSTICVHGDAEEHEIHDLSAGGLSFFSHLRVAPGKAVTLSAKGILSLQVIVIGCELEEADADLMEYRYRVRAEFTPDVDGFQAFVLTCAIYGRASTGAVEASA
jgi:hypothetical protein